MARPANGTHTVSRNGPSLPIKSSNSLFHPLNSMYGLFHIATAVIISTSTGTPIPLTNKQPGSFSNLRAKMKFHRNSIYILSLKHKKLAKVKFLTLYPWAFHPQASAPLVHPWRRSKSGSKNLWNPVRLCSFLWLSTKTHPSIKQKKEETYLNR